MTDWSDFVQQYPVGDDSALDESALRQLLQSTKSWEDRYRQLLQLAKQVPAIPLEWRLSDNEVSGCESRVWLLSYRDSAGKYHFAVDSESRIVKSLLITLLALANHKTADKIQQIQVASYFAELGFAQNLSPSRSNGLNAVWKKMSDLCAEIA